MFERLVLERIARILAARDFIIGMEGGAENLLQLYHGEGGYSLAKSDGAIGRIGRIGCVNRLMISAPPFRYTYPSKSGLDPLSNCAGKGLGNASH